MLTPIVQGGSFALLAFIVIWLTTWLPKRWSQWDLDREADRKMHENVSAHHRDTVKNINEAHITKVELLVNTFKEETRYEREVCERRHAEIMARQDSLDESVTKVEGIVDRISDEVRNVTTAILPLVVPNPIIVRPDNSKNTPKNQGGV